MAKRTKVLVCEIATASILAAIILALLSTGPLQAAAKLPSGFREEVVISGLTNPTNVEFSKDGRVFVAEKSGLIKVFDNLSDTTPTTFADLRTNVHNFWDRGLLGLALAPNFPTDPSVYVLYTHDAPIGGTAPRWGTVGATSDACPDPPGATVDGCVVSGRLSKLRASGNTMTGSERVMIEDWCQQYYTHSVGTLAFGSDGALYVSGGEGAKAGSPDYGQGGGSPGSPTPKNPCGDPPGGVGATLKPPTAEGGALRAQDLRTGGDPVTLDGAILRIDPANGAALRTNPLYSRANANARRIVAYGLRNPFRFTIRPGTSEVWVGDVGWRSREEINRIASPTAKVNNFGWPCYEGAARQAGYDSANLNICENLYGAPKATTAPYYAYSHGKKVVSGEACVAGNSSVSGLAFYRRGPYPDRYDNALFFSDYSRKCIWAIPKSANSKGLPDPSKRATFATGAANPVELETGPGGDLFYVDMGSPGASNGTIRRISYPSGNRPPTARATANPTSGALPLTVSFDATKSTDPEGGALSYAWDLDGDGEYDDSTSAKPTYTYTAARDYRVGLKVSDNRGASDTLDRPLRISAGNTAPVVTIASPAPTAKWKVGQRISFSGSASDEEDGALAASRLSWSLTLQHCSPGGSSCHAHPVRDFPGVASGTLVAPDHEYPSYLQLRLTATDSRGLSASKTLRLNPETVRLSFASRPTGARLVVGPTKARAPFSRTVIVGSTNSISAPSPQRLNGKRYKFASWSDGRARTHNIVAPATAKTYRAVFKR